MLLEKTKCYVVHLPSVGNTIQYYQFYRNVCQNPLEYSIKNPIEYSITNSIEYFLNSTKMSRQKFYGIFYKNSTYFFAKGLHEQ